MTREQDGCRTVPGAGIAATRPAQESCCQVGQLARAYELDSSVRVISW